MPYRSHSSNNLGGMSVILITLFLHESYMLNVEEQDCAYKPIFSNYAMPNVYQKSETYNSQ